MASPQRPNELVVVAWIFAFVAVVVIAGGALLHLGWSLIG